MRAFAFSLLAAATLAAEPAFVLRLGDAKLTSLAVTEASGLAASPSKEGFLWMVNDSGGTPEIHLAQCDGTSRGAVQIEDARNIDWEDLAAFQLDGKPYLLIADTGDNGDFLDLFGQSHRGRQFARPRFRAAHDFQQSHNIGRRKEVQT